MKRRVLVIDDHPVNRMLVSHQLRRLDVEVVEADSGEVALAMLDEVAHGDGAWIDVVLLDLRMPGLDGHGVLRRIRLRWPGRPLPVIAYTAHATPEEQDELLADGFDGLLAKPVDFESLKAVVGPLIGLA
jgi:CheY-like chemotaxis protein